MKLLNQLIIDEGNTTIKRLVFSQLDDVLIHRASPTILSADTQYKFRTENLKGWEFGNGDYLIMNL